MFMSTMNDVMYYFLNLYLNMLYYDVSDVCIK